MFMKTKFRTAVIIFSFLFISSFLAQSKNIKDIIAPVKLIAGLPDTIVVSDLFYSENYDLEFEKNSNLNFKYDKENMTLTLKADPDFEGITILDFCLNKNTFSIPVYVKRLIEHEFVFKSDKNYNSVYLFGSFNNWNRSDLRMTGPDGDEVFSVSIKLEPGKYEYKFLADGDEILDPTNPITVPNGIGGINSLIEITNPHTGKIFLHKLIYDDNYNSRKFKFYFESDNGKRIEQSSIFAFIDNNKVENSSIVIDGNSIEVLLSKEKLSSSKMLRVAVSVDGVNSNLQMIPLNNGKPLEEESFNWYNGVIYSLMIDRFSNGNKENDAPVKHDSVLWKANYMGGDFEGIAQKINEGYFDSLGINILWLSPVNDNPNGAFKEYPPPHRWYTGYHGYWPIDFYNVEEKFGSFNELKNLISTAHNNKVKVLLDFVSHHVHEENPYFKNHRDWFGKLELPGGKLNLRLWDEHRLTTWFEPYLPSFDFINSTEALNFMTNNAIWWLKETGADGFRHDAVKHVPNIFWRELTKKIKKEIEITSNANVYQIGETFGNYTLVNSYVNNGQLNAQFNFELYNVAQAVFIDPKRSFRDLDNEMNKTLDVFGALHLMGNIMDSHDKNRFMAYADGAITLDQWSAIEEGWANPPEVKNPYSYKKAELYYAYMFSIPGLPVIYYGSEFGMTGLSDPDNRRMMRFGDELSAYEKEMLNEIRKIVKIRNENSALRYGDFYTLIADNETYAFVRSDFYQRILVVLNKSDEVKELEINLPDFYSTKEIVDIKEDKTTKTESNSIKIKLEPRGWKFYEIN